MFDFDASKMIVVGAIALIVVGPKDLPRVLRTAGQILAKARRIKADMQKAMTTFIEEEDFGSIKKELASVENSARVNFTSNPEMGMRGSLPSRANDESTRRPGDDKAAQYDSPEMEAYLAAPSEPPPIVRGEGAGAETAVAECEPGFPVCGRAREVVSPIRPDRGATSAGIGLAHDAD